MKKIAHRIDEDNFRARPQKRLFEFCWNEPEIEPILIRMTGNASKPLGKSLGVTVFATGADF